MIARKVGNLNTSLQTFRVESYLFVGAYAVFWYFIFPETVDNVAFGSECSSQFA